MVPQIAAIGWEVLDRIRFSDIAISPHGLGIAVGYLAGSYVFIHEARKRGIPEERSSSLVLWALLGAIVGARGFYVLGHFSEFDSVLDMLAVWRGGISLIGGILGGIIFAVPTLWRHRISFPKAMDPAVIGIGLGIVIGRIGDLIIGDHLGKPTSWLLAFRYEGGQLSGYDCGFAGACQATLANGQIQTINERGATLADASGDLVASGIGVHQTALYDLVSTMALVVLLLYLNSRPRRTGTLALTFGLWYGTVRIITDFLRVDKTFFGLTGSQWASIGVVLVCLGTLVWFRVRPARPAGVPLEEEAAPTPG